MICQACGVEAATEHVSFHQNIGLLVVRLSKSVSGDLCKSCIHKNFWSLTGATALMGWWGVISFIVTPFILLSNVIQYATCLRMEPVPAGAEPVVLTAQVAARIEPHADVLVYRLQQGTPLEDALQEAADRSGTSVADVKLYLKVVIEANRPE